MPEYPWTYSIPASEISTQGSFWVGGLAENQTHQREQAEPNFQCHLPVVQKEMKENEEGSNYIVVDTFLAVQCVRSGTNEDCRTTEAKESSLSGGRAGQALL